jgi:hypothetical protein
MLMRPKPTYKATYVCRLFVMIWMKIKIITDGHNNLLFSLCTISANVEKFQRSSEKRERSFLFVGKFPGAGVNVYTG